MPSINHVTLMGHVGKDSETTYTQTGTSKTQFSLATTRRWKQGEEWKEETDWHNIVAWQLNTNTAAACVKGHLVYVEGRIQSRSYEKNGEKKYITEVVADRVYYLRPPNGTGKPDYAGKPAAATTATAAATATAGSQQPSFDDDIPF